MRLLALMAFSTLIGIAVQAYAELPGFARVKAGWRSSELRLLDRRGQPLQEIRVDAHGRRTDWTSLDQVSPAFIAALLRAEDRRFFDHAGVDWLAAGKAALTNWLAEKPRGASTLSMQLAALLDGRYRGKAGRRDAGEKWDQMQGARELESTWSKARILEAYLNLVPFRGELTGIDAAARGLFDKRPAGLSDAESLILAALIRAPNARPEAVAKRVCALAAGADTGTDCAGLRRLTLHALGGRASILSAVDSAPHLAQRLLRQTPRPTGSFSTTLDGDLQRFVSATLREQLARLGARNVHDAAALVLDNASGEVLAYASLGSAASASPHSDGVTARRQAGSTLKPFLYGLALEKRLLTAASPIEDAPLSIATSSGEYTPQNYDRVHRGLVSLRTALASSLNIPAVRTLQLVGLEPFAARLARFGFRVSEAADFYGPALALGSLDVSLEELANAYRGLANGGLVAPLRFNPGSPRRAGVRAASPESAFLVADILSDRQARAITFGLENPLATRFWTAVKTGTSKDMRDNWCVGFSSRFTVGVWVGNFSGEPMHDVSGVSGAAPAWAAIMGRLHAGLASRPPKPPPRLARKTVTLAGAAPGSEWFLAGTEPPAGGWSAAAPPARILQPGDGDILALDPDIPPERQRLALRASHAPPGAWWQLDEARLAEPDWPLVRGRHELILRDEAGAELDRARFEVR
jgi:penicillin-binding protein 1C